MTTEKPISWKGRGQPEISRVYYRIYFKATVEAANRKFPEILTALIRVFCPSFRAAIRPTCWRCARRRVQHVALTISVEAAAVALLSVRHIADRGDSNMIGGHGTGEHCTGAAASSLSRVRWDGDGLVVFLHATTIIQ